MERLVVRLWNAYLLDRVVWSGTGSLSFINWKPSVCRRGRWNMSLRDSMVSMARSEKRCCPPLFFDVRGFQDLMTDGDIQRVKEPRLHRDCSYSFQLVTLYFFLYFGLRLLLCNSFMISPYWMVNVIWIFYLCTNADVHCWISRTSITQVGWYKNTNTRPQIKYEIHF